MVQSVGRYNSTFHQTKVNGNVGSPGSNDSALSSRVDAVLFGLRVEGREIVIMQLFIVFDVMMQLDGVSAFAKESVSRFESGDDVKRLDHRVEGFVVFLVSFPFALRRFQDDAALESS